MKKTLTILFILISAIGYSQSYPASSGYLLTNDNGSVSIGTRVSTAPLTVSNFLTSFPTPQTGTILHLVSDAVTNGRLSFDTYNNSSFTGSNYQGRRARGTAELPTAALADDILVAIGGDGYGDDSFTNSSVGSMNIRANETFTNSSKPTYISFTTTPTGSITQVERVRIKPDGTFQITGLNAAGFMQTDASGNISSPDAATTRTNLGLGTLATQSGTFSGTSSGTNTGDNATNTQYSGLAASKQDVLVSGTNIKTVNGNSLLGSGNVSISGAPTFINLANNFSSTSTTPAVVTGWSFAVTSGTTYRIEVIADYQTAATTTGGIFGISLTNSAAGTVRGSARGTVVNTAAATELVIPIRATSGAGSTLTTTGVTAANSPHAVSMIITFTCTVSGTFNIVWGTEVNASAAQLNQNSSLIYQALN